jgi:hypothetical protein
MHAIGALDRVGVVVQTHDTEDEGRVFLKLEYLDKYP